MEKITIDQFKAECNIDLIQQIMDFNNGYVTSKQLTDLGIHRMYLNIMQEKGLIEKVRKGIYMDKNIMEDVFYTFQLKYPKTFFSRFTALYFYGLTEVYPSTFDITADSNYNIGNDSDEYSMIRCTKDNLNLGLTRIKTSFGNEINLYDRERCICDIIKYKNKLDLEQIKKSVRMYVSDKNKNITRLGEYAKKLNVYDEVMNFVGMYYE